MLGAIIGDIVGSRWEFNPTNDYNFELFSDKNGFTDDTICTVAVADAILRDREFGESIHEWCRRYPHPMGGYGGRFAQWVRSDNPQPYGSYGNGAAMRVSPIAWAHLNLGGALPLAEESASCTHNHPEGIKGAQTTVMAIHYGIEAHAHNPQILQERIKRILDECVRFSGYNINIRKEDVENRFDETCQGTVPVALWIIGQSTSFEDAIRRAVSLGADADTLGAIVGSIAEAIWGIPEEMQLKALNYLPNDMKSVVLRFYHRFVRNSILHGYGDEGAARDLMLEEERKEMEKQTADDDEKKQFQAIMLWKLGLGNMGKFFIGEEHMPPKTKVAKSTSWKIDPMPQTDISRIEAGISITEEDMAIIRKGHIPEAQEDHWFMYCSKQHIRYYRSWTGTCAFEAHFLKKEQKYIIDEIIINHALVEFGVNGDEAGVALFLYLLIAEVGGDAMAAWDAYLDKWDELNNKYAKKDIERHTPIMPSVEIPKAEEQVPKPIKIQIIKKRLVPEPKTEKWTDWYNGLEDHICKGCIYSNGIRAPYGCGRLGIDSFKQRYTIGKCEYRKTDLYIPSDFEKEHKRIALQKKQDDEFEEQFLESEEDERLRKYSENREREEKAKQDGSYAKELIQDFIKEKLDGDINKLATFDFGALREDQKYGDCKGFAFSVDKCNIVKAIMSIVFTDVWPELNQYNIERYKYLCGGINYTQYLFGANIMDKFFKGMDKFNPTKEQHERAVRVYHLTECIGNIWVLPGGIDKDKDTYHYHGYADLFLKGIYAGMTGNGKVQPDLKAALYKARKLMKNYQGSDGFRQFALDMMLNDYIDYYGKPIDLFMHVWSMMKGLKPETYFKAVDEYCDFMEQFVPKRGKMIVEKLIKILD